ncbi:hypothetical protein C8Q80DRAFT_314759 [Daedaleopsis nitida]|nr:hypothetical protein C8Q80DRAFT_314759 [Daedaleopsis nitida]
MQWRCWLQACCCVHIALIQLRSSVEMAARIGWAQGPPSTRRRDAVAIGPNCHPPRGCQTWPSVLSRPGLRPHQPTFLLPHLAELLLSISQDALPCLAHRFESKCRQALSRSSRRSLTHSGSAPVLFAPVVRVASRAWSYLATFPRATVCRGNPTVYAWRKPSSYSESGIFVSLRPSPRHLLSRMGCCRRRESRPRPSPAW